MLIYIVTLNVLWCFLIGHSVAIEKPGPRYPPTKGEVWPKPQKERKEQSYFVLLGGLEFDATQSEYTCDILDRALSRYSTSVRNKRNSARHLHNHDQGLLSMIHGRDAFYKGSVPKLHVLLGKPCEEYPQFEVKEDYVLKLSDDDSKTWFLRSDSLWGILRGLETYSQLFYYTDDYKEIRVNATDIEDFPRYAHRGLLLDTSRHYISVGKIKRTLEAMAMNKMNVFHWHIVDDQSFPFVSETFPELSSQGAFHPTMVYTKDDVANIVNFARDRGIRVVPEFDVPGHTRSWGVAFPLLLTECYDQTETNVIGLGPMNPIKNTTYKLLQELFQEVQGRFPDRHFHIGGDEVELSCWHSNPELREYIKEHNLTSIADLHALFMERALPLLAKDTTAIVWQEVFDEKVPLSKDVLVHIWKSNWIEELLRVLQADYKVLFSAAWYLDHLANDGDWEKYYNADPAVSVMNATLAKNIVGGEACMWGESVDNNNVISRVWPRASAVAERLWSPMPSSPSVTSLDGSLQLVTYEVKTRLEEHTCRMIRRGVKAQPPNGPGFCFVTV